MALKCPNGVHETTTTAGTGELTLGGAVAARRAFSSQLQNGELVPYSIDDGDAAFEFGLGTYTNTSGQKLSRDVVLESSNGNEKVDWPASGTRNVRVALSGQLVASLLDEALGNGLMARTGARTYAPRALQDGGGLIINNPGGVADDPSLSLDPAFSMIWTAVQSFNNRIDHDKAAGSGGTTIRHIYDDGALKWLEYLGGSTGNNAYYLLNAASSQRLRIEQDSLNLVLAATGIAYGGQTIPAGPAAVLSQLLSVDTNTSGLNANFLQGFDAEDVLSTANHIGAKVIGWCLVDTAGTILSQGGELNFTGASWSGSGAACTVSFTGNAYGTAYLAKAHVQDSTGLAEGLDANVGSKAAGSVIVNTTVTSGGGLSRTKRAFGLEITAGN